MTRTVIFVNTYTTSCKRQTFHPTIDSAAPVLSTTSHPWAGATSPHEKNGSYGWLLSTQQPNTQYFHSKMIPTAIPTNQLSSPSICTTKGIGFPFLHCSPSDNPHPLQGSSIHCPGISQLGAPGNPVVTRVLTTTFTHAPIGNFSTKIHLQAW